MPTEESAAGKPMEARIILSKRGRKPNPPIPMQPVYFEQDMPEFGGYREVASAVSGNDGMAIVRFTAPDEPGSYRYRAQWDGNDDWNADKSPVWTLRVVSPT